MTTATIVCLEFLRFTWCGWPMLRIGMGDVLNLSLQSLSKATVSPCPSTAMGGETSLEWNPDLQSIGPSVQPCSSALPFTGSLRNKAGICSVGLNLCLRFSTFEVPASCLPSLLTLLLSPDPWTFRLFVAGSWS